MFYGFMLGYEEEELIPSPPSLLAGMGHWDMSNHTMIHRGGVESVRKIESLKNKYSNKEVNWWEAGAGARG